MANYRTLYKDPETVNIYWGDQAGFPGSGSYKATGSGAAETTIQETVEAAPFILDLTPNITGKIIQPGSVNFVWGGVRYIDRLGKIYRNPDPTTGQGAEVGAINYETGEVVLDFYDTGTNAITVQSLIARHGRQLVPSVFFRTPGAPLRPGSLSFTCTSFDGQTVSGTSNFDGTIDGDLVTGNIDYEKGMVMLYFGERVPAAGNENEDWYSASTVKDGTVWKPVPVFADTIYYVCVVYSYIPLNADLIGLDPVRLPVDGRVPIVKVGDVVVVHNTQATQLQNPLSAGQVITLPRPGISYVELYDVNEQYVPSTKYTWNEQTQKLTMATPLDLTGFAQPLVAMHRIEDMCLVSDVQINGQITVASPVVNDYPVTGTYVSSALLFGDLRSRYFNLYDQKTWTNAWSNDLIGDSANATYNEVNYPILVTNQGAVTERWAIVFTASDYFYVMGEKLGIVATGYTTNDCQPINPATGQPFFFIDYRGWGSGWVSGNVLRFSTEGANHDLWIARTTLQGPVAEPNDQFTIQIRGDAE